MWAGGVSAGPALPAHTELSYHLWGFAHAITAHINEAWESERVEKTPGGRA